MYEFNLLKYPFSSPILYLGFTQINNTFYNHFISYILTTKKLRLFDRRHVVSWSRSPRTDLA